ncbi:Uncharacterised protein [Mycobacteroides abscessus subsp. abscessus]|nr:Uncharacterised protein [Mycobacteroides abscessus subsp. abscessus]
MQRGVVEQGGLAAEQLDQLIAQATTGGRWCDYLRQEPLERGGQQMRRTLKVPIEGGAGNLGCFGDSIDGDGFDSSCAQKCRRSIQ